MCLAEAALATEEIERGRKGGKKEGREEGRGREGREREGGREGEKERGQSELEKSSIFKGRNRDGKKAGKTEGKEEFSLLTHSFRWDITGWGVGVVMFP